VLSNIVESFLSYEYSSALNMWQVVMANHRIFLRGYGANFRGGFRRRKAELFDKMSKLDKKAEEGQLDIEEGL
jgi:hypothetical protein